ncbi:hypothetical protein [Streptomyces morookaense]|uniref:Uncharacterized protein n=1 Tax=Streptomyces morookaense TaxID=1970 RepID=A0A7Y7B3S8_STRMO|nr:hypothetical protein [Streptomyces morookaense]NVK78472.1 hypothetical protein [Streptomyces morookaense]GHF32623.1 hypothetical protein GCM10010359_39150 [Streptomyces morookaense]
MPKNSKTIARARMQYLGEPREAALAAVPRDKSLGLDTCSPGQRRLRALLALGLFNRSASWPPRQAAAAWGLHTLVAYDIIASPRYNRLVLITDVPHNVAPYLLPSRDGGSSLPGLRLEEFRGHRTYIARHLPTGAQLVITGNPSGTWAGEPRPSPRWDFYGVGQPLTSPEQAQLEQLSTMSDEAELLLAGLTSRIAAQDADGNWAIGNWFSDPLMRPGWLSDGSEDRYEKELYGSGSQWTFRWNGFPYVEDVAASLTAPLVGIRGAVALDRGNHLEVRVGGTTLSLRGRRAAEQREPEVTS